VDRKTNLLHFFGPPSGFKSKSSVGKLASHARWSFSAR